MSPAPSLCAFVRRILRDERGAVSVVAALLLILGVGFSALVIDSGHLYLAKRRLQSRIDAAALAAVGDVPNAGVIVAKVLALGGYSMDATIETGGYSADSGMSAGRRFDSSASQSNAVRITKTITVPTILAGAFGAQASQIRATATAARIPLTAFAAGTDLANMSGGTLNGVLGGLLGTTLSLSLANYQALAAANVDAVTFLDQLAAQVGIGAGTYGDLADANATIGQLIAAARATMNIQPGGNTGAALDALNVISLQAPQAASAVVSQLVDTAVWQKRRIGSIVRQTPGRATINLFDLIAATARVYGAGHLVTLGSAISLPITGTSVSTRLVLGSPMSSIAVGGVGTTVSTAQARLALTVTAVSIDLGIARATVTLPVYLQLASGQARVAAIPCQDGGVRTRLSLVSQTSLAQIGAVNDADLSNFDTAPSLAAAPVVALNVLGIPVSIKGGASLPIAAGSAIQDFTQADIDAGIVKTAAGSDAGHVFSGLAGRLTLVPSSSGGALASSINDIVANTVTPLLRGTLVTLLTALDPVTDTLLKTLGLRLGAIDTVVRGVSCGAPTLVQ
jgi:uncharacterized membrane protein